MKKKLLSIVLSLCMILTLLPTFALASGGVELPKLTETTTVESGKVYTISDADSLAALSTIVNGGSSCAGATFVLTQDITLR